MWGRCGECSGAKLSPYHTPLASWEKPIFLDWIRTLSQQLGRPLDPDDPTYDYRGFWRSQLLGGRGMGLDPSSGQMHFPDTFKTPDHPTFSNESQYATPGAPHWTANDTLVDPQGDVTLGYLKELMRRR